MRRVYRTVPLRVCCPSVYLWRRHVIVCSFNCHQSLSNLLYCIFFFPLLSVGYYFLCRVERDRPYCGCSGRQVIQKKKKTNRSHSQRPTVAVNEIHSNSTQPRAHPGPVTFHGRPGGTRNGINTNPNIIILPFLYNNADGL